MTMGREGACPLPVLTQFLPYSYTLLRYAQYHKLRYTFSNHMPKYGKKARQYVEKEMHKYKHEHKWKNPDQAVAVGLREAREHGVKVPHKQ